MASQYDLELKLGDRAPAFSGIDQNGETVTLKSLKGKYVLLYFYPKDNTPGCTVQACGLRDHWQEIRKKGAVVLGVSADSVKSHERFAKRFKLPFSLLADTEKEVATAYGAWGEKKFMGRTFTGMRRVSFLIGPDGKIVRTWPRVKTAKHAEEVLLALKEAGA